MQMLDTDKSEGAGREEESGKKCATVAILSLGLVIGIVIGVVIGAFWSPQLSGPGDVLTPKEAGDEAVEFITNYAVLPGTEVELINVTEVEGESIYKIVLNLSTQGMTQTAESFMTKDGKLLFPGGIEIEEVKELAEQQKELEENQTQELETPVVTTIGNFIVSGDELCREDENPIVYFFGSDGCPACEWEYPVIVNVTAKFAGYISFHDNKNNATADREIFAEYSTGYIPTLVLGCTYYRVGAGRDVVEETNVLTALICNLTGSEPADVCSDPEIVAWMNQI
jgi:thiol-disulfide isomerase/thioredoxin